MSADTTFTMKIDATQANKTLNEVAKKIADAKNSGDTGTKKTKQDNTEKEAEKEKKRAEKEAEKLRNDQIKAAKKVAKEIEVEEKRLADAAIREQERVTKEREKYLEEQVRSFQRSQDEEARIYLAMLESIENYEKKVSDIKILEYERANEALEKIREKRLQEEKKAADEEARIYLAMLESIEKYEKNQLKESISNSEKNNEGAIKYTASSAAEVAAVVSRAFGAEGLGGAIEEATGSVIVMSTALPKAAAGAKAFGAAMTVAFGPVGAVLAGVTAIVTASAALGGGISYFRNLKKEAHEYGLELEKNLSFLKADINYRNTTKQISSNANVQRAEIDRMAESAEKSSSVKRLETNTKYDIAIARIQKNLDEWQAEREKREGQDRYEYDSNWMIIGKELLNVGGINSPLMERARKSIENLSAEKAADAVGIVTDFIAGLNEARNLELGNIDENERTDLVSRNRRFQEQKLTSDFIKDRDILISKIENTTDSTEKRNLEIELEYLAKEYKVRMDIEKSLEVVRQKTNAVSAENEVLVNGEKKLNDLQKERLSIYERQTKQRSLLVAEAQKEAAIVEAIVAYSEAMAQQSGSNITSERNTADSIRDQKESLNVEMMQFQASQINMTPLERMRGREELAIRKAVLEEKLKLEASYSKKIIEAQTEETSERAKIAHKLAIELAEIDKKKASGGYRDIEFDNGEIGQSAEEQYIHDRQVAQDSARYAIMGIDSREDSSVSLERKKNEEIVRAERVGSVEQARINAKYNMPLAGATEGMTDTYSRLFASFSQSAMISPEATRLDVANGYLKDLASCIKNKVMQTSSGGLK